MSAAGMSEFQKYQFNTDAGASERVGFGMPQSAAVNMEESKTAQKKEGVDDNGTYEKWRGKKTWKVHKGGVYDLAWSPDNIHLGTCGTDSTVIIWNINETSNYYSINPNLYCRPYPHLRLES